MNAARMENAVSRAGTASGEFDFARLDPGGVKGKIASWLFDDPQWWMGLLRRFWPVARLPGGWAMVTRYEHEIGRASCRERV